MNKSLARILALVLILSMLPFSALADTPSAQELAEGYIAVLSGLEWGTAGATLKTAAAAGEVCAFAERYGLYDLDADALQANLRAAYDDMGEDGQAAFWAGFDAVRALIDDCLEDDEANHSLFEDAGVAETMDSVMCDPLNRLAWENLRDCTLSMRNDEGMPGAADPAAAEKIDYLALVNKLHPLPEGWEEALETVTITNSVGDEVEVEARAYAAYLLLKADLEEKDGIYLELDSARRSVAAQQDIMDRFIEKYGADYAAKTVATPGYSEHHTGLALDLYFRIKNDDGTFTDVYYNEDMTKPEYEGLWATVHAKLADYGFILRYLEGKEYITGYGYEPWHIRYIDDADMAKEIMAPPGMTLEVWLGAATDADVAVDYGISELYTPEELKEAAVQVKCRFASFAGCELHTLRYAGDECNTDENLAWMNHLDEGKGYVQVAEFISDFHSPLQPGDDEAWEADKEYTGWQWWLARTADGGWQLLTWGY